MLTCSNLTRKRVILINFNCTDCHHTVRNWKLNYATITIFRLLFNDKLSNWNGYGPAYNYFRIQLTVIHVKEKKQPQKHS